MGVGEYVELLKERTLKLHEKVVDTKKILIDNKIDLDRHYPECKELLILRACINSITISDMISCK